MNVLFTILFKEEKENSVEKEKADGTDTKENEFYELHDEYSKSILEVEFPPFYFSTHGLSRPPTPEQKDIQRYSCKQATYS